MSERKNPIRTRIAPSPTGELHVGTARSALYNELLARQSGGKFILRLEDTDRARSKSAYEQSIIEGLAWLGIDWNEGPDKGGEHGPYRQSERGQVYRAAAEQLLLSGRAYQVANSGAIKLRVGTDAVVFNDLIRGQVTISPETWGGDFVIARSLTDPVFHLAVVVDDWQMKISHVIRGEDHLSNTARHILLQQALGYKMPIWAHLPLLLNERRQKLSKRSGDTSVLWYRAQGYLPAALLNYLALLGWNPGDEREWFSHQDLIAAFSLERVQKGGAVFSAVKLKAMNRHYLRQLSASELWQAAVNFCRVTQAGNFLEQTPGERYWQKALTTEQSRADTLKDLVDKVAFFRIDWPADYPPELLVWKKSTIEKTSEILGHLNQMIKELPEDSFTTDRLQFKLLAWIEGQNIGRGDVLWPMRVALTGQEHSPGPFEVGSVLGKEATLARLTAAQTKLATR